MNKEKIYDILTKEIPKEQILADEPMKKHTSFKIGGKADLFVKVKSIHELKYMIRVAKKENIPITIVGNGSNILVKDNGVRGIVLKLELNQIVIEGMEVVVGAGVKLGELAQRLLREEKTGFEFAAGIPGTIGGAVRMNAGAYGGQMQDIIIETKCLDLEQYEEMLEHTQMDNVESSEEPGEIITLTNREHEFSYRHSIFMEKKYIVLETRLQFKSGKYEEIKAKMDQYLLSRKEKQPLHMPSAGSTFKRGTDYITAKLIDECGLKGYQIGDAQVSDLHAGFVVNLGNATAIDVLDLVKHVQDIVYQKTGKEIELEIEILGE